MRAKRDYAMLAMLFGCGFRRYSQLTQVFGILLYEKRLREEDLRGLREDKLKPIRSVAKFFAEDAA